MSLQITCILETINLRIRPVVFRFLILKNLIFNFREPNPIFIIINSLDKHTIYQHDIVI